MLLPCLGQVSSEIGHPWQGSVTEQSVQNQCSIAIGCDKSRDEATHYTIGVSIPQNPFLPHKLCIFKCYIYSTAWVINYIIEARYTVLEKRQTPGFRMISVFSNKSKLFSQWTLITKSVNEFKIN